MTRDRLLAHDAAIMTIPVKRILVPVCSGAALAFAFPTWHLVALAWVALAPLFYVTRDTTPRRAATAFFLAGWVFYSIILQWLLTNVYWSGGWAVVGYQALCLFMAAYWGLLGALLGWLRRRAGWLVLPPMLGLLWATMEWLQATLFSGFGWGALAYSQGPDIFLAQWAALGGTPLVSAILVTFNGCLAEAAASPQRQWRFIGPALGLLVVVHVLGMGAMNRDAPDVKPFTVGIIQPDFPLEMKWDPEYTVEMVRNTVEKSRELARQQPIDLFVWPESLVMDEIDNPEVLPLIQALCKDTGAYVFTGSERFDGGHDFNSSALVDPDGNVVGTYDKVHLAPFGEYVPLGQYLPFIAQVVPAIGNVSFGGKQEVFSVGNRKFGPLICFEVLFTPLAQHLRAQGANMLVVITNLGWFGASNAIPEELEIARFRAIETRLPVVHSANTGLSGLIGPWGRFTPVQGVFNRSGEYVPIRESTPARDTIMRRCAGIFVVPPAEPRLLPGGPLYFPYLALALSVMLVLAGFIAGKPAADRAA